MLQLQSVWSVLNKYFQISEWMQSKWMKTPNEFMWISRNLSDGFEEHELSHYKLIYEISFTLGLRKINFESLKSFKGSRIPFFYIHFHIVR
jgi:hypothetical protein